MTTDYDYGEGGYGAGGYGGLGTQTKGARTLSRSTAIATFREITFCTDPITFTYNDTPRGFATEWITEGEDIFGTEATAIGVIVEGEYDGPLDVFIEYTEGDTVEATFGPVTYSSSSQVPTFTDINPAGKYRVVLSGFADGDTLRDIMIGPIRY